jgi:sugar lactone lactonase YvrE
MPDMLDRFSVLTEDLDHPEDLVWDPATGRIYAGGEAGQIYAVSLDGEVAEVADTGGGILGLAVDAAGVIYACDEGRAEVLRVDPGSGAVEVYSSGTAARPMIEPNYCAFDAAGDLYVTDSSDWEEQNGAIYRVAPGGETVVWTEALRRYPNGCCLAPDGRSLLVVESSLPGVWRVPIGDDGSAGTPALVIELPAAHVPDGIALDESGDLYIACYRPDRVYRLPPGGALETLADDPLGLKLNTPTNVAFVGADLDRLAVANVGEWHLLLGDIGRRGAPLFYPRVG